MLEINTIEDFRQLSSSHQTAILRELKTKDRLDAWVEGRPQHIPQYIGNDKVNRFWESLRKQDDDEERNNADIHPSQVHKCLLKLWYDCNGYETFHVENVSPRLQQLFDLGSAWHDWVQKKYGEKGAWGPTDLYHREVKLDPDAGLLDRAEVLWIRGHVDAAVAPYLLSIPGLGDVAVQVVHEYKTINSNGYSGLKRPKSEHKWQATIYSFVLDVPIVVYMYWNKDNSNSADFPLAFDPNLWKTIDEKIERVQYYTNIGSPPPWEESSAVLNPQECGKCGYLNFCRPPLNSGRR